jgi:3-hydroxymyristoyl/3-hydroxydecanoyl-(acyl carrier protein) dehydratase
MNIDKPVFPTILNRQENSLALLISSDLAYLDGHFPNTPIVAGVVQIHWAVKLAKDVLGISDIIVDGSQIKFSSLMRPGDEVTLSFTHDSEKKTVSYQYANHEKTYSSGRFTYA